MQFKINFLGNRGRALSYFSISHSAFASFKFRLACNWQIVYPINVSVAIVKGHVRIGDNTRRIKETAVVCF